MNLKLRLRRPQTSLLGLLLTLAVSLAVTSCARTNKDAQSMDAPDNKVSASVVYGTDGRLDLFQVTDDRLKKLADSTVALIKTSDLSALGLLTTVNGKNFGLDFNLCLFYIFLHVYVDILSFYLFFVFTFVFIYLFII